MPPPDEAVAVRDVLNRLAPQESLVAALYYFEDLSVKQVSEILGIPEGTVKTRLFRARASLKNALAMEEESLHD